MSDASAPQASPPPARRVPKLPSPRRSLAWKVVAIVLIVFVLMVPLALLGGLINEREQLREQARLEVSAQWGQDQTLGGPVLTIPYTATEPAPNGGQQRVTRYAHLFPDALDVEGTMAPQVRTRGIFRVVLYEAQLTVRGQFPPVDSAAFGIPRSALRLDEAFVQIGISDLVGVREPIRLRWDGTDREADPGIVTNDVFSTGVTVPVRVDGDGAAFSFRLSLNGSGSLGVLPVGRETTLRLASPWDTPRFAGAFLPEDRTVADTGFEARWRVLHLNRNYPQAFAGGFGRPTGLPLRRARFDYYEMEAAMAGGASAFGVELLLPVDEYQKTNRAAKYGVLFVFLTFLTFFFVEVLGGRRIHPIQYLLVGFAVTLFYLLLLAFAEYLPFNGAYGVAAVAILSLVVLYARAVFGGWRLAALVGGLLTLFYGYFFVLLQLEAYALLAGSLGLLVTLAVVMYLSRQVDWYDDPFGGIGATSDGG
ncbi:cell envelope integrity protein CreD [Rubrivirga sp. IMCC45206]|uniref:cell envelope integrity protein CreD n=1 Tax=Rubrivirga sp. IMCC45206 TaxID=3391614 RepID=UPI00399012A6